MEFEGQQYLVTVDTLSGFFEIDLLRSQSTFAVTQKLRMIFARFGTPDILVTDNGPPFASQEFTNFAAQWRVTHRRSSPHYPRSNGQAEAAVKIAKDIMTKARRDNTDVHVQGSVGLSQHSPYRHGAVPSTGSPTAQHTYRYSTIQATGVHKRTDRLRKERQQTAYH